MAATTLSPLEPGTFFGDNWSSRIHCKQAVLKERDAALALTELQYSHTAPARHHLPKFFQMRPNAFRTSAKTSAPPSVSNYSSLLAFGKNSPKDRGSPLIEITNRSSDIKVSLTRDDNSLLETSVDEKQQGNVSQQNNYRIVEQGQMMQEQTTNTTSTNALIVSDHVKTNDTKTLPIKCFEISPDLSTVPLREDNKEGKFIKTSSCTKVDASNINQASYTNRMESEFTACQSRNLPSDYKNSLFSQLLVQKNAGTFWVIPEQCQIKFESDSLEHTQQLVQSPSGKTLNAKELKHLRDAGYEPKIKTPSGSPNVMKKHSSSPYSRNISRQRDTKVSGFPAVVNSNAAIQNSLDHLSTLPGKLSGNGCEPIVKIKTENFSSISHTYFGSSKVAFGSLDSIRDYYQKMNTNNKHTRRSSTEALDLSISSKLKLSTFSHVLAKQSLSRSHSEFSKTSPRILENNNSLRNLKKLHQSTVKPHSLESITTSLNKTRVVTCHVAHRPLVISDLGTSCISQSRDHKTTENSTSENHPLVRTHANKRCISQPNGSTIDVQECNKLTRANAELSTEDILPTEDNSNIPAEKSTNCTPTENNASSTSTVLPDYKLPPKKRRMFDHCKNKSSVLDDPEKSAGKSRQDNEGSGQMFTKSRDTFLTRYSSDISSAIRPDDDGDLPLHIAVVQGALPVVDRLIDVMQHLGVSIDTLNNDRQTALHLAIITNQSEAARLLLDKNASTNISDRHGNGLIHLCVKYGSLDCLRLFLGETLNTSRRGLGTYLNALNYEGLTPIHLAVQLGSRCQFISTLISAGANVNALDGKNGRTPLYFAAEGNDLEAARVLLLHGADSTLGSYSGCTAAQVAAGRTHLDVLRLIDIHSCVR